MSSKQGWTVLVTGLLAASVAGCGVGAAPGVAEVDGEGALASVAAVDPGSAANDDGSGAPGLTASDVVVNGIDDPRKQQAPPVKVKIYNNGIPFLAMVAVGATISRYTGQTEYWHASDRLSVDGELQVVAVPLALGTEASIDEWVSPLSFAFSSRRLVSPQDWAKGPVKVSSELVPYLMWAPHPDEPNEVLGLMLATTPGGQLVSAAWYRSSAPGQDGLAFKNESWSQRMELVRDRDGVPSADPSIIRDTTWFSIAMPLL